LGLHARENLGLADGFFQNDQASQLILMEVIRRYRPEIVLANALEDRHPDHGKGAKLAIDACFLSGLRQIKTGDLSAWRPAQVYHYIQDRYIEPDFVVDISAHWDQKEAAIRAFKSQFFDPSSVEPASYISSPDFLNFIQARAMEMGHKIGVKYGEGFQSQKTLEKTFL
jgi:bacillithiol biosynthesis deacetylase BshB1